MTVSILTFQTVAILTMVVTGVAEAQQVKIKCLSRVYDERKCLTQICQMWYLKKKTTTTRQI